MLGTGIFAMRDVPAPCPWASGRRFHVSQNAIFGPLAFLVCVKSCLFSVFILNKDSMLTEMKGQAKK
jgi:hypothetical protein